MLGIGRPPGDLAAMEQTHPMKFRRLQKILHSFGLLWPSIKKFNTDNGFFLASGIAFNVLINLIPLILLLLAVVGTYLYNDQAVLDHLRAYFRDMLPALDPKFMKFVTDIIQTRHIVGIIGFIGLLWFSTFVFGSLRIAFDIVFRVKKSRKFLPGIGIDLLMILLTGILLFVSMFLSSAMAALQNIRGPVPVVIGPAVQWLLKYAVPFVVTVCMFFVIYKILPNTKVLFKSAFQAALVTGLLWELTKQLFTWYVVHVAQYSVLYGKLNALVLFVVWVYYSSAVLVLGGEFAYLLEENRQRTEAK